MSGPAPTEQMHTEQTPRRGPGSDGVANRYELTDRERRRRHWWWVLAVLAAILVGLITYALARNRGDATASAAVALSPAMLAICPRRLGEIVLAMPTEKPEERSRPGPIED